MSNTLKYSVSIIILSIIGFLSSDSLFSFAYSEIENDTIKILSRNTDGQFYAHILFALSIGMTPLLYLFVKKITRINFLNRGLISYTIILASGFLLWRFRIFQLKTKSQIISDFYNGNEIQKEFEFSSLQIHNHNLEYYVLIGFLIGTILSLIIFKKRTVTE